VSIKIEDLRDWDSNFLNLTSMVDKPTVKHRYTS
jgi:hypothetical protein